MPENPQKPSSGNDYQRVGFGEFFKISWWAFKLVHGLYPIRTIVWLVSSVSGNIQNILYTLIFSRAVDQLIKVSQTPNASLKSIYPYVGYLLLYNVITTIISFIRRQSQGVIRQTSRPKIRQKFYYKLNSLGIETLEQPNINDKITRAEDYLSNIMPFLQGSVELVSQIVGLITNIVIVFTFMPIFVPVVIASSIPYILFDKEFRKKIYKVDYENTAERRRTSGCAADLVNITKLPEIITTKATVYLDNIYITFQNRLNSIFVKMQTQNRIGSYLLSFVTDTVVLWGYVQIFIKLIAKAISVGDVLFWIRTFDRLQQTINNVSVYFNDQFELSIQLKDTYALFNTKPAFKDGAIELPVWDKGPSIEYINVDFKYPRNEKLIFKNLNLKIQPGEKIAIVGPNGAGKTTLVKLLSRLYPIESGEILINQTNLINIKSSTLYENMGVLFQDYNLYPQLTVMQNISIGRPDRPLDETKARVAAQTADCMDFVNAYPNKFDQLLDPRLKGGIRPSTGQWQKLAIARFFYRNAPLVIFDEPTASIDAVSEYNIFNQIWDFFENKTVIIISHRFSTVRNADRIIVLNDGQIVEEGSHNELMQMGGQYQKAFLLQAEGYKE